MGIVRWLWNPRQSEALLAEEQFICLEGGTGAGKTTPLLGKVSQLVVEQPGIQCLLFRWTEDALNSQLKPAWRDFAHKCGLRLRWHPEEEYDEILGTPDANGQNSRVYLKGLKTSQEVSKYQKIRGLNLAFIGGDQVEELPYDYFLELIARLRQVGYSKQFWCVCQPVPKHHWIDRTWPIDNSKPGYRYIRTNCYDNVRILGQDYIDLLERTYPEGSAERRTLLEGRRGLTVQGDPVYRGYFSRKRHEQMVPMNPELPLYEAMDFGHHHPCLSWHQFEPVGRWVVLGAVMGRDMFVEDFVPAALQYRSKWFSNPMEVHTIGDPAGVRPDSRGSSADMVSILAELGIDLVTMPGANSVEARYAVIQAASQYMKRRALDGEEAFIVCPRQIELSNLGPTPSEFITDGFEAGYIWDNRIVHGKGRTIRVPKKDNYYDHFMNTFEYAGQAFSPAQPTQDTVEKAERAALRRSQEDADPDDERGGGRRRSGGGGYLRSRRR